MLVRRALIAAGQLVLVGAVALLGGWPDPGRSLQLLTGTNVTSATASALVVLLCWLLIALLAAAGLVTTLPARHRLRVTARGRCLSVLAVGITVLGLGIARHEHGYSVCCANAATTELVQHLVH